MMKASRDDIDKAYDTICKRINCILADERLPDSMRGFVILNDNTLAVDTRHRTCEVAILKDGGFGQWMKAPSDVLKKKDLVDLFLKSAKTHDVILARFLKAIIKKGETIENLTVEHDLLNV